MRKDDTGVANSDKVPISSLVKISETFKTLKRENIERHRQHDDIINLPFFLKHGKLAANIKG
jgi:hypothetical protein